MGCLIHIFTFYLKFWISESLVYLERINISCNLIHHTIIPQHACVATPNLCSSSLFFTNNIDIPHDSILDPIIYFLHSISNIIYFQLYFSSAAILWYLSTMQKKKKIHFYLWRQPWRLLWKTVYKSPLCQNTTCLSCIIYLYLNPNYQTS